MSALYTVKNIFAIVALSALLAACGGAGETAENGSSELRESDGFEPIVTPPSSESIEPIVTPSSSESIEPIVTPPSSESIELSPADTVAALADPERAEEGVWSILANLGIGVYTADGGQVLAGSEINEDDFWLYDFEVISLMHMNERVVRPFSEYYELLERLGLDMGREDMLLFYGDMYSALPDNFLSQLFVEMDMQFAGDPTISPLQEYLLLVSLLPPNPLAERAAKPVGLARPASFDVSGSKHCGAITGDGSDPDYAIASKYAGTAAGAATGALEVIIEEAGGAAGRAASFTSKVGSITGPLGKLLEASKMGALLYAFETRLEVSNSLVHQPHDTQGESPADKRIDIVATVILDPNNMPESVLCGSLAGMGLPVGPLTNAGVRFRMDDVLAGRGILRAKTFAEANVRTLTDGNGQASRYFEPDPERPKLAQEDENNKLDNVTGHIRVEVDVVSATGDFFNFFAIAETVADVFNVFTVSAPITVEWHKSPAVTFTAEGTQGGVTSTVSASTCDGVAWEGVVLTAGDPGGVQLSMSGEFAFTLPEGDSSISIQVPSTGTMTFAGGLVGQMQYVDTIEFMLDDAAEFMTVTFGQRSDVRATIEGFSASGEGSFPEVKFVAPLEPLEECEAG